MNCQRKNNKRSLYYDEEREHYIKYFTPKLKLKLKYWFGFRNYPGLNFQHIAQKLSELGLHTPTVISADKYVVVTKEIHAPTVGEYFTKTNDPTVQTRLVEIIASILNAGIVFFDFHYDNFLYKNGQFYVLDLEGYTDSIFVFRGRKEVLYRIEKHLGVEFRNEVDKRWNKVSLFKKCISRFSPKRYKKIFYAVEK